MRNLDLNPAIIKSAVRDASPSAQVNRVSFCPLSLEGFCSDYEDKFSSKPITNSSPSMNPLLRTGTQCPKKKQSPLILFHRHEACGRHLIVLAGHLPGRHGLLVLQRKRLQRPWQLPDLCLWPESGMGLLQHPVKEMDPGLGVKA